MGHVEIADGITNRRQEVPGLRGTIRIDVADLAHPVVIVPEGIDIQHRRTEDHEPVENAREPVANAGPPEDP